MSEYTNISVRIEDFRRFISMKGNCIRKTQENLSNADFLVLLLNFYEKKRD